MCFTQAQLGALADVLVAGGWGVWLPWIPCTKTCGSGKRQRYRQCNNPLPMFGGACVGDSMKTKTCTLEQCPSNYRRLHNIIIINDNN